MASKRDFEVMDLKKIESEAMHLSAESEFLESVGYYESKVKGLGQALISAFSGLVSLIVDNPEAWQVEAETGIRKALLSRFPLTIILN